MLENVSEQDTVNVCTTFTDIEKHDCLCEQTKLNIRYSNN